MNSKLLDHRPILDGRYLATVALRPIRLAYIIPCNRLDIVQYVVAACCLQWGGRHNLIVPASEDGTVSPDWLQILRATDPDLVVDAFALSDEMSDQFSSEGWRTARKERLEELLQFEGAATDVGLMIERNLPDSERWKFLDLHYDRRWLVHMYVDADHELYLPSLAQHGLFATDLAPRWRGRLRLGTTDQRSQLPMAETDIGDDLGAIFGIHTNLPSDAPEEFFDEYVQYHTRFDSLPSLTSAGLQAVLPEYMAPVDQDAREVYDRGFLDTIVVTGRADSISDFALYWSIRSQRPETHWLPLWLPIDYLDSDYGQAIVMEEYKRQTDRYEDEVDDRLYRQFLETHQLTRRQRPVPKLYIISQSVGGQELIDRLIDRYPDAVIQVNRLSDFACQAVSLRSETRSTVVEFSAGRAHVALNRHDIVSSLRWTERVAFEIEVEGVRLPRARRPMAEFRPAPVSSDLVEISDNGAIVEYATIEQMPSILTLSVPSGWEMLDHVFRMRGYEIRRSSKSNIALEVGFFFDEDGVSLLLNSSRVYEIMQLMSRRHESEKESRAYVFERLTRREKCLSKMLGGQVLGRAVIGRLVSAKVLRRGTEVKCPACQLNRWYPLERLSEDWMCDGCGKVAVVPLGTDATHWSYRINELCAHAFDQGAVTAANAMMIMEWEARIARHSLLGYFPGVELSALDGAKVPFEKKEVDIAGLIDGQLVICECKETGKHLETKQAEDLVTLGRHLNVASVIFASASAFSDEVVASVDDGSGLVRWIDRDELFDSVGFAGSVPGGDEKSINFLRTVVSS